MFKISLVHSYNEDIGSNPKYVSQNESISQKCCKTAVTIYLVFF